MTVATERVRRMPFLIGESAAVHALRREIFRAARSPAKVLISGETGAGKEIVARLIHTQSQRVGGPFVAVNCGGIPDSLLESELFGHVRGSFTGAYRDEIGLIRRADSGTLFLDEVGEMSLRMQAALLRFTETGEVRPLGATTYAAPVTVRPITATHRDLRAEVAAGTFREDLYYRLNVIQIHVPPLRVRGEDILLLFEYFLNNLSQAHGRRPPVLTPETGAVLRAYAWPGNVRELRNVVERLLTQECLSTVTPDDLPAELRSLHGASRTVDVAPTAEPVMAAEQPTRRPVVVSDDTIDRIWSRLEAGEDFWTVVGHAFKARELTRADLAALIDRGLRETLGSYRALLKLFHLPPTDYKRFHSFLYQQHCNLPVAHYRRRNGYSPRPQSQGPFVE